MPQNGSIIRLPPLRPRLDRVSNIVATVLSVKTPYGTTPDHAGVARLLCRNFPALSSGVCGKKRKDRSTEISIAFAMIALVAAILIVYFDTAYKLKLLDERIENIEMSGPQTK